MGKVFHVTSLQFYMFSTEISLMQHFVNTVPVPISSMQQFFDETFLQCNISSTRYLFLQCNSSSMKHLFNATFRQHGTYFFNATVLLWNISSIRISELGYLAGAGAVTLARLHLEYFFNNSRKKTWNLISFDVFSKVNIKYDLHVHVLERILDNS